MTATEELCRLLDERGVKWTDHGHKNHIWWKGFDGVRWHAENRRCVDGWRVKVEAIVTPEQAIAATLGPGTCHAVRIDSFNGEFTEYDHDECSYCGDEWDDLPNYCPNCGRKVADS